MENNNKTGKNSGHHLKNISGTSVNYTKQLKCMWSELVASLLLLDTDTDSLRSDNQAFFGSSAVALIFMLES